MILKQLNATNFRSFKDISLSLPRGLVCFYGENAAGKSTILETIQFVLTGRSFRATDNDELIQKDHKFLKEDSSVAKHLEAKNKKGLSEIEYYKTDEYEALCLLNFYMGCI